LSDQHSTDYSPESILFWLKHWPMLISATEGGTCSNGLGAGRGKRQNLSDLKADLELAADKLPIHWQSTEYVFYRQRRAQLLRDRRQATRALPPDQLEHESPIPSKALDDACWKMARALGWIPQQEQAA
jgi:hypothetical protein